MKEEILSIASDLREGSMTTNEAKSQLLVLFGVSNSDVDKRSRFQKDIDDCYAHEDEEEGEAGVCLHPAYAIIGCHYNDGRTCDGCKYQPKQTDC